jgi:glycosyltransferase involved in cell wall biosynthesis
MESSERYTLALLPLLKIAERFCLRRTQASIFVSEFIRAIVKNGLGYSTLIEEVIRNGVDLNLFSPCDKEEARRGISELSGLSCPIVLHSGRLLAMKGIYVLASAAGHVLKDFPDARFVFAGSGTPHALKEEIARLALPQDRFIFLGKVEHSLMPRLYAAADVCVIPSLTESCPMSLLEAMASVRPVVASAVGDIPSILKDGVSGLLVPPGDVKSLASSITRLLRDRVLADRISERGRKVVKENHSTREMAARTFKVYQRVLEGDC